MIFILQSQWNESITQALATKAFDTIRKHSTIACDILKVPGALELPLAAQWLAEKNQASVSGLVACGCVIKGETFHFEIVANESARGLAEVSLKYSVPIANAILAVFENKEAIERSSANHNKGEEAALSLLKMIEIRRQIKGEKN